MGYEELSLWRTVKYEDIYIRDYASLSALTRGLEAYFRFYNHERYHQSLDYAVPAAAQSAAREQILGTCKSALFSPICGLDNGVTS